MESTDQLLQLKLHFQLTPDLHIWKSLQFTLFIIVIINICIWFITALDILLREARMSGWKPAVVLYRALRKHASTLQYTDKDFYLKRIKKEFGKNKYIVDEEEIHKLIKVGFGVIFVCFHSNLDSFFVSSQDIHFLTFSLHMPHCSLLSEGRDSTSKKSFSLMQRVYCTIMPLWASWSSQQNRDRVYTYIGYTIQSNTCNRETGLVLSSQC